MTSSDQSVVLSVAACYYGKRRKLSKPLAGEEVAEGDLAKPARRRKKRKAIFVQKKRRTSAVDYTPAGSPQVGPRSSSSTFSFSAHTYIQSVKKLMASIPPSQLFSLHKQAPLN